MDLRRSSAAETAELNQREFKKNQKQHSQRRSQAGFAMLLLSVLIGWFVICSAKATLFDSRVLVVHDPGFKKADYSTYFGTLEAQGLQLSFRSASDSTPALFEFENANFDHVLLLAASTKSLPVDLSPQKLVQFLQNNGNILFALSSEISELYRDLAREFELELEDRGTTVIDHFSALKSDSSNSTIAVPNTFVKHYDGIFAGVKIDKPFLYKGIAHRIGASPLAFPIVKPPSTSYSFDNPQDIASLDRLDNPDRQVVIGTDADVSLISAFQLLDTDRRDPNDLPKRKGSLGRAVFCGSIDAFSNKFISQKQIQTNDGKRYDGTSNLSVLSALTSWLLQRQGVLRVEATAHSRVKMHENDVRESYEELDIIIPENGEQRLQKMYRIKDTVTYSIDLVQRSPKGWQPAPTDLDLQVSLVMLDPYITTNLTASQPKSLDSATGLTVSQNNTPRATRYSTTFQLPDRHGVYTFIVDFKRHGWSYIHTRDTTPVRPFNSDEHPRGLHSAWPYVSGSISTVIAFLVFVSLWLTTQEESKADVEKKSQ